MRTRIAAATGVAAALGAAAAVPGAQNGPPGPVFSDPTTIDNRYLPLTARRRCELRGRADDGTLERNVVTLLERTKRFDVEGRRSTRS